MTKRTAVEQAAYGWWCSKRPMGWYEPDHVDNATVNCQGKAEHALANAVAEMVESERYR